MKLLSYQSETGPRIGVVVDEHNCVDIAALYKRVKGEDAAELTDMLTLVKSGDASLDKVHAVRDEVDAHDLIDMASIEFLAPLPLPESIRDFANYELHCQQALAASMKMRASKEADPDKALAEFKASGQYVIPPYWYEEPLYYKCNRFSISAHNQTIHWPHYSNVMDYELELAAIIGKTAKDVKAEDAADYIFGYTIYNDFSARDAQSQEMAFRMGPAKGKDFDNSNAFGPWIVTRDEMPDPYNLHMEVRVNGEVRGSSSSGACQHNFERCIQRVSMGETLRPGEILALGTVGNGAGFESLQFLNSGDVVECDVENIGVLRNTVVKD